MTTEKVQEQFVVPAHKVGIKLLDDLQMQNVFPNYRNLIERIENHRKCISGTGRNLSGHYQYNMMYDNVFSIFGKRGTGKTSVAFTIQKKFEENTEHPYDIVFPIIIPEVIPAGCSALGWLLAIVGEKVQELTNKRERLYESDGRCRNSDFWEKCKYSGANESASVLAQKFECLEELYFSMKYNSSAETSYSLAVGNSARQAKNYYRFAREIAGFWDALIDEIVDLYELQSRKTEPKASPLLYFIFDDVDLAPEKVDELMSMIIKYLSHPNIIVITTADEEMVLEVIENNLDKKIGEIPKEWRSYLNSSLYEQRGFRHADEFDNETGKLISETARMYLGKIMPTSTRYYLRLFEKVEEKQWFRINDEYLGEEIKSLIDKMLEQTHAGMGNFLVADGRRLNFYLSFFGNTSRQIGNAFFGLKEFVESVTDAATQNGRNTEQKEEDTLERIYHLCTHFLHVAINANHSLAEMINETEEFVQEMFWLEHNGWKLYINYKYLRDFLRKLLDLETREKVLWVMLQLYSLFLFVENIILILDSCPSHKMTGRDEVHGIIGMTHFICDHVFQGREKFRNDLDTEHFFLHYEAMLYRICKLSEDEEEKFDREYLYDFLDYDYVKSNVNEKALVGFFDNSREWLRETAGTLSMVYGNVYTIGKKEIEYCIVYKKENGLCRYQKTIREILEKDIYTSLDCYNLRYSAKEYLDNLDLIILYLQNEEEELNQYSSCLQRDIRENIETAIREKIIGDDEEKFWDEDSLEREVQNAYERQSTAALTEILKLIDRKCEDDELKDLVNRLPEELGVQIMERLLGAEDKEEILLVLNILQDYLIRWDYKEHDILLVNVTESLYHMRELAEEDISSEMAGIAENISAYFYEGQSGEMTIQESSNCTLLDTSYYADMKSDLHKIYSRLSEDRSDMNREGIIRRLRSLEKGFDIGIDLENMDQFRGAVIIGIITQVIKRLQKIYLYMTVVRKHELRYDSSSVRLEKMVCRNSLQKTKKQARKNSYYYAMFLTMGKILEKKEETSGDTDKILKNIIQRASSEKKHQYLSRLINEAKDESNTY